MFVSLTHFDDRLQGFPVTFPITFSASDDPPRGRPPFQYETSPSASSSEPDFLSTYPVMFPTAHHDAAPSFGSGSSPSSQSTARQGTTSGSTYSGTLTTSPRARDLSSASASGAPRSALSTRAIPEVPVVRTLGGPAPTSDPFADTASIVSDPFRADSPQYIRPVSGNSNYSDESYGRAYSERRLSEVTSEASFMTAWERGNSSNGHDGTSQSHADETSSPSPIPTSLPRPSVEGNHPDPFADRTGGAHDSFISEADSEATLRNLQRRGSDLTFISHRYSGGSSVLDYVAAFQPA